MVLQVLKEKKINCNASVQDSVSNLSKPRAVTAGDVTGLENIQRKHQYIVLPHVASDFLS